MFRHISIQASFWRWCIISCMILADFSITQVLHIKMGIFSVKLRGITIDSLVALHLFKLVASISCTVISSCCISTSASKLCAYSFGSVFDLSWCFWAIFDNGELGWKDEGSSYFVTVKSSSSSCVLLLSAEWHHCGPLLCICISPSVCCFCTNTTGLRRFTASIKQQSPQPDARRLTPPPQRPCGAVRGGERKAFILYLLWVMSLIC